MEQVQRPDFRVVAGQRFLLRTVDDLLAFQGEISDIHGESFPWSGKGYATDGGRTSCQAFRAPRAKLTESHYLACMQTGQHVWFIGFMGAGKSHWAARTADVLGLPLIDLDAALQAATGRTVAALFDELGEAGFRALEAEEVRRVAGLTAPHVIATGGGTPELPGVWPLFETTGRVIWLDVAWPELAARLSSERDTRPLLAGPDWEGRARALWLKRRPVYARALEVWRAPSEAQVQALALRLQSTR